MADRELLLQWREALQALERFTSEMTVGERYTNLGQYAIDALEPCRSAIASMTAVIEQPQERPNDTQRLDWLLASDAVTHHDDGSATFAFVFADAKDLRGAIDDLMGAATPIEQDTRAGGAPRPLPELYLSPHTHGNRAGQTVVAELATARIVGVLLSAGGASSIPASVLRQHWLRAMAAAEAWVEHVLCAGGALSTPARLDRVGCTAGTDEECTFRHCATKCPALATPAAGGALSAARNVNLPHPLMITSGEFWRCDHGNTGLGPNGEWVGCKECDGALSAAAGQPACTCRLGVRNIPRDCAVHSALNTSDVPAASPLPSLPESDRSAPPRGCVKPDTDKQVFFYEQDFYVLSNFSAFNLQWVGLTFQTSEAAYHWEKFAGWNADVQDMIYEAPSAHEAFKIAESYRALRRPDWDDVKVGIMKRILRTKAGQHEYVRRKLLATGDRELIEDSWRDDFWGWGPDRDGQNMLGKLWMEVRSELRQVAQQSEAQGDTTVSPLITGPSQMNKDTQHD